MDVGGWLRGLGLGQYEDKFRDNKVDTDLLPRLTADDLRDIGVSAVGDRRRLLDAIAALAGALPGGGAVDSPPEDGRPSGPPMDRAGRPHGARLEAERRPITVLFCDLVGSTGLSARLDAEDWRNLVSAYLDAASAAVTELGGHVLKKLGDGLMALFGYPQAQENDAERAVRAALAIQRALAELNARNAAKGAPELSARIGLDSGPVVVDATGEVFGDAPNIAARVQAAAEPGTVMVTARVQRQTAGLFVAEDKGAPELKGVAAPVNLFRIVRASGGRRFGARALTPLVGREEELDLLRRRWEKAVDRRGPARACGRRTRDRQVAPDRGVSREARRDSAHLGRILILPTLAEYALAPGRRMGPPAFRRRRHPRWPAPCRPREHAAADRSRPQRACAAHRAPCRHPFAAGPRR